MNQLLHFDQVVVSGVALEVVDGSVSASGFAGFENSAVPSASGNDYSKRARIARSLRMQVQFGADMSPDTLRNMRGVQITARDTQSGRRVLMNNCEFASMGDVGTGPVDVSFLVLAEPQWL
jgi:hypothetical protein